MTTQATSFELLRPDGFAKLTVSTEVETGYRHGLPCKVAIAADCGNDVAQVVDFNAFASINADLTFHCCGGRSVTACAWPTPACGTTVAVSFAANSAAKHP